MDVTSFFFPLHFQQLSCHKKKFFLPLSAMPLPQLVSISGTPSSMHFGHFTGRLGNTGRTRISVISLPKFNFLSPLTHGTSSCNFGNTIAEIQSFSSFYQITLNSTYNNNKLHFLPFLAKRLLKLQSISLLPKFEGVFGLLVSVIQFSVSITHNSKIVGSMTKRLFGKQ